MTELVPKSLAGEASRFYQDGDFIGAARLFAQAADGYEAAGSPLDAAEMRNNQSVALLQANDPRGALDCVLGTAQVFAEAGDLRRQGLALGNEAAALEELNRLDEAIERYNAAADLLGQAGDDQSRAIVMQSVATLQVRRGKFFDGLFAMNSGLAGVKKPTLKQKILRFLLKLRTW